jgi:hypothetical protein
VRELAAEPMSTPDTRLDRGLTALDATAIVIGNTIGAGIFMVPQVVAATLPGEAHAIGLQMAALVMAAGGLRVSYLGTEVPVAPLAGVAKQLGAHVVALSLSAATDPKAARRQVAHLERVVPRGVSVLLGGAGASHVRTGALVMTSLDDLDRWARRLGGARRGADGSGPS